MISLKYKSLLIFLLLIIINPSVSAWWGIGISPVNQANDHYEMTDQALDAVNNNDTNGKYEELYNWYYQWLVATGAGTIDFRKDLLNDAPQNKQGYIDSSYSHFYNPNGSAYNNQWPSALEESYDWLEEAINAYAKNNKRVAYEKLGYIMHLQQDMAVPAHTYLISHGAYPSNIWDDLEWQVDADNIDASSDDPIIVYPLDGNDIYAIEKQFNELARKSYNESDVQSTINTYYQNRSYVGSNYDCSLLGTCSPQISSADVEILQNDLMPKAVQYSAGLAMRVYDIFQSLDWPTENHDYRRTGFTLLKGDMADETDVDKTAFVLSKGIEKEQVVKPLVADLDGNGKMETVTFVHDPSDPTETNVYNVEKGYFGMSRKWFVTLDGDAVYFPGSLADIDDDSDKEMVAGTWDGTVHAYDDNNERWTYTLANKWSSSASANVGYHGGGNAVVDLDLDGNQEIILADVYDGDPNWAGEVYVLEDETTSAVKEANYTFGNGGAYATISVANLDDDDNPEIVVPSLYGIFVLDYNSSVSNKLSKKWSNTDGRIQSSAIIADVDMDNEYEIKGDAL